MRITLAGLAPAFGLDQPINLGGAGGGLFRIGGTQGEIATRALMLDARREMAGRARVRQLNVFAMDEAGHPVAGRLVLRIVHGVVRARKKRMGPKVETVLVASPVPLAGRAFVLIVRQFCRSAEPSIK